MKFRSMRWMVVLSGIVVGALVGSEAVAFSLLESELSENFVTVVTRDNVERFRVDLDELNGSDVEVAIPKDKSFTVVTAWTNAVTVRADGSTNLIFLDIQTNVVGKVDAPPKRFRFRSTQMPVMTR